MSTTLHHGKKNDRLVYERAVVTLPGLVSAWASQRQLAALSGMFSLCKRLILTLLILLGACTLYDQAIGDGRLPRLNDLSGISSFSAQARSNTTLNSLENPAIQPGWNHLAASRELLTAVSPEIAAWLYTLHEQNRIVYGSPLHLSAFYGKTSETPVLAAYEKLGGKLYIGNDFWVLNDGEKAAILAHEFRHSRQNWPKVLSHRLAQLIGGGQFHYQSSLEAEAFAYERQVRSAFGLSPLSANLR